MKKGKFYFSSDVSELIAQDESAPSQLAPGETYSLKIPIFREGKFKHPWYGDLNFNLDYLEELRKNFQAGVYPQKVSFDVDHRPGNGAVAWLEDPNSLTIEQVAFNTPTGPKTKYVLFANAELNPRGYSLVKNREYRYFSSEIHPNFSTHEVENVRTKDQGDIEAIVEYGAVLVGGGLTNRPFVPHLGEVGFSETGVSESFSDSPEQARQFTCSDSEGIKDGLMFATYSSEEGREPKITLSTTVNYGNVLTPGKTEDKPVEAPESSAETFTENNEGDTKMKFTEVLTQLKSVSGSAEQIAYLKSVRNQFSNEEAGFVEDLIKTKEDAAIALSERDDAIQRKLHLETEVTANRNAVVQLKNDLAEAKEGTWRHKVAAYSAELRQNGQHESVVKTVEGLLNGMKKDTRDYKFSVASEGGDQVLDIIGFLNQVFSAMPKSALLDTTEQTSANEHTEVTPAAASFSQPPAAEPAAPAEPAVPEKVAKFVKRFSYMPAEGIWDMIDEDGFIA